MGTSPLDDDLGFQLVRAAATSTARMRAALESVGLRARSYSTLALAVSPGSLGQRELATRLLLDPSQIVPVIDDLERRGLVERTIDPNDRRGRLIVATDAGRAAFAEAEALVRSSDPASAAGVSAAQRAELLTLLRRIADAS